MPLSAGNTRCWSRVTSDDVCPLWVECRLSISPDRRLLRGAGAALHPLDRDPLDLIERDRVVGTIVEFRRARAFMRGHSLRVLQRAAGFQIGGDAGGTEGVAADLQLVAGF